VNLPLVGTIYSQYVMGIKIKATGQTGNSELNDSPERSHELQKPLQIELSNEN